MASERLLTLHLIPCPEVSNLKLYSLITFPRLKANVSMWLAHSQAKGHQPFTMQSHTPKTPQRTCNFFPRPGEWAARNNPLPCPKRQHTASSAETTPLPPPPLRTPWWSSNPSARPCNPSNSQPSEPNPRAGEKCARLKPCNNLSVRETTIALKTNWSWTWWKHGSNQRNIVKKLAKW